MALKGARFDLDAARRAYDREREPLGFRFMAHDYIVMREPSLGDTFDVLDTPEHTVGENDAEVARVLARFIRYMIPVEQRSMWDDDLRMMPVGQAAALVELAAWITEQVTAGFPTSPPANSSAGRAPTGRTSRRRTAGTAA